MQHEVHLRRVQQHFIQAGCSCGWLSAARRSESLAAEEGRDHAILYDGAFSAEIASPRLPHSAVTPLPSTTTPPSLTV
jgi:hypothetical protein